MAYVSRGYLQTLYVTSLWFRKISINAVETLWPSPKLRVSEEVLYYWGTCQRDIEDMLIVLKAKHCQ